MNENTMMMLALAFGAYYGYTHGWFSGLLSAVGGGGAAPGGGAPPGPSQPAPPASPPPTGGHVPYAPGPPPVPVYNPIPYPGGGTAPANIPGASATPPNPIDTSGVNIPGMYQYNLGNAYNSLYMAANPSGGCLTWGAWMQALDSIFHSNFMAAAQSQGNTQLSTIYCMGQAWPVIAGMLQNMGMSTGGGSGYSGLGAMSPWSV